MNAIVTDESVLVFGSKLELVFRLLVAQLLVHRSPFAVSCYPKETVTTNSFTTT